MLEHKGFRKYIKELYGITKLVKFGTGYALILPKTWVEYCTYEDEVNSYWVKVIPNSDLSIRIEPIEQEELKQIRDSYFKGMEKIAKSSD